MDYDALLGIPSLQDEAKAVFLEKTVDALAQSQGTQATSSSMNAQVTSKASQWNSNAAPTRSNLANNNSLGSEFLQSIQNIDDMDQGTQLGAINAIELNAPNTASLNNWEKAGYYVGEGLGMFGMFGSGIGEEEIIARMSARVADSTIATASTPGEIAWGYGDLSSRQAKLLEQLPGELSSIKLHKSGVNATDLAALTAKSGDEFAMFTRGSQRLIIRGSQNGVNLASKYLENLKTSGFKWSAHTHPGTSDSVLDASGVPGDRAVLKLFNQNRSLILNSVGRRNVFDMRDNLYITDSSISDNVNNYFSPNF